MFFLVMELCKRGVLTEVSLAADKTGEVFADDECRDVFQQMVLGIEYRKFFCVSSLFMLCNEKYRISMSWALSSCHLLCSSCRPCFKWSPFGYLD